MNAEIPLGIMEDKINKLNAMRGVAEETGMSQEVLIQWATWCLVNMFSYEDFLVGAELGMTPHELWTASATSQVIYDSRKDGTLD